MFIHPFLPSLDSTSLHPSQCILSAPWVAYSVKWLPYTVPKVATTYSTWSGYHIQYLNWLSHTVPELAITYSTWSGYHIQYLKWLSHTIPKVASTYSTWSGYHIMYTKQTTSWHSARHSTPFKCLHCTLDLSFKALPCLYNMFFGVYCWSWVRVGGETSRTSDLTFGAKFTETRKQIFNYKHANRTKYKYLIQRIYSKTFKKKS